MNKFYITTPIYYVNDVPHVGHVYTTLAADIVARHYRLKYGPEDTFFLTGTDEHGAKIEAAAQKVNKTPKEFCDEKAETFREAWKLLNIQYDNFIRTTDTAHEKAVQKALQILYDKKFIYKGQYEGLYCVGCEQYKTPDDLIDGKCPDHRTEPQLMREESYFFKLSQFQEELKNQISEDNLFIRPQERKKEILNFIESGLKDVSISRKNVGWGIPLPFDKNHTTYVWVDAFLNYLTGLGWNPVNDVDKKMLKFWPPDVQLMAKDILRVHATIWTGLLLALGIDLPRQFFVHGFFTINGQKMSKSLGNVISPQEMIDQFGVDGTRYLLMSEYPFGNDGDLSLEKFKQRYNSDLANGLGNLASRVAKLCEKVDNFPIDEDLKISADISNLIEEYKFNEALRAVQASIAEADKIVNEKKPWTLEGTDLTDVLSDLVARIRQISKDLESFMPETSNKLWQQFGAEKITSGVPLFLRK